MNFVALLYSIFAALTIGHALGKSGRQMDRPHVQGLRRLRAYGSSSGGGGAGGGNAGHPSSPNVPGGEPPSFPPVTPSRCSSTCSITVESLGVGLGTCLEKTDGKSCSGGILIKNPTKGCGGDGCQCCITNAKLFPSKTPPPPPPVTFPPAPPGSCSLSRCFKQVPGLGEGYGACISGKYSSVCRDNGGFNVVDAEGCDVNGKDCHCCVVEGRLSLASPPPSAQSPVPPPFPPQPGVCSDRQCRKFLSDGLYGFGSCVEGSSSNICVENGLLPAGSDAEGCGEDGSCHCCGGSPPSPPETSPSPPPPPETSPSPPSPPTISPPSPDVSPQCITGSLCGVKNSDASITYGRCITGKTSDALKECSSVGGVYLGTSAIGCSGDSCFCCGGTQTKPPQYPPPPPPQQSSVCGNLCGIQKKSGDILYGKCLKKTKNENPERICSQAGGVYPGDSSIGCSDGCVCCTPDTNSPPPPPTVQLPSPPPPPVEISCNNAACAVKESNGGIALGKCFTGSSDPEKTCTDKGLIYAGDQSIGCDTTVNTCHCCRLEQSTGESPSPSSPQSPQRSPPPPSPRMSPPPPPSPKESPPPPVPVTPSPPSCPATCSTVLDGITLNGVCVPGNYPDYDAAVAACAGIQAVPIIGGCGNSCGVCCIDSSELCSSSTANGSCEGKPCECILTSGGGSCNKPLYPGYDPPPGNGGGCQENLCNAFAVKEGVSAGCCPFGC